MVWPTKAKKNQNKNLDFQNRYCAHFWSFGPDFLCIFENFNSGVLHIARFTNIFECETLEYGPQYYQIYSAVLPVIEFV